MPIRRIPTVLIGLCLLVTAFAADQTVRLVTRNFGPKTDIRIRKPNLVWEAWPEGEDKITKVNATLDGKRIDAKYDSKSKRIRIETGSSLAEGVHRVEMEIYINNWAKFRKEWSFNILPESLEVIPEPDEASRAVIEKANEIRKKVNLDPFILDARLCHSAKLHSEYMSANNEGDHVQYSNRPKFVAETPAERMEQYGFSDSTWEILAPGIDEIEVGLQRLFDAPFHRISFLQPGKLMAGGGFVKGCLVVDGQATSEVKTVVSPSEGQQNVPLLWKDREIPDPMRIHKTDGNPTGYPIVFVHYTPEIDRIEFQSAVVKDENGVEVPIFINSPKNDQHLTNAVFLFTKSPMEPGMTYQVAVRATDKKGKDISKSWTFKTENEQKIH
jgi:hypothetical protein